MKLRLLIIGGVNALIGAFFLVSRGYSNILIAYFLVGLALFVGGLLMRS